MTDPAYRARICENCERLRVLWDGVCEKCRWNQDTHQYEPEQEPEPPGPGPLERPTHNEEEATL